MGPFSTHSLSILEWTQILRLWLLYAPKLSKPATVEQFIKYVVDTATKDRCWIGRSASGSIEALLVFEPRGDVLYVDAWVGPARYIRFTRADLSKYTHIAYHRAGKYHQHKLL